MNEEDFAQYLNAYIQASTGQQVDFPPRLNFAPNIRLRSMMAVAAFDAMAGRAPRSPPEVAEEVDRICAGVLLPPPATGG